MMYDFKSEFSERCSKNLKILRTHSARYEVTGLLSTLLSIFVVVNENYPESAENLRYETLALNGWPHLNCKWKHGKRDLQAIIKHMRNAMAHAQVNVLGNGEIESVEFIDIDPKTHCETWSVVISLNELELFTQKVLDFLKKNW